MLLIRVTLLSAALANASTLFSVAIPSINNSTLVGTSQTISSPSKSIPASQTPGPVGTCTSIEGKAMQTCFQWPQPGQPHPTASATTSTSQNATTSTAPGAQSYTASPPAATSHTSTTPPPSSSPLPPSSTPPAHSAPIPASTSTSSPKCPVPHLSHRSSSPLTVPISDNPSNTTLPASSPLPSAPAPADDCTLSIDSPLNLCSRGRNPRLGLERWRWVQE
ncbi:hypothetical protein HBI08_048440 [Parastagonospora nodorum]|nr:hypothetical protein HBI08_048440 [Parastagonospora nodorum]